MQFIYDVACRSIIKGRSGIGKLKGKLLKGRPSYSNGQAELKIKDKRKRGQKQMEECSTEI